LKTYLYILFVSIQLTVSAIFAQQHVEFQQLSSKGVEAKSITYAVKQDSIGNVWVASDEGVLRYDSKKIQVYNSYKGLPEDAGNRIMALFVDSKQRVWIGLERGVCVYNPDLDVFDRVSIKGNNPPNLVRKIAEDVVGNIWIGAYNGLWKCKKGNAKNKVKRIIGNYDIEALYAFRKKIIFSAVKGLFVYDRKTDDLQVASLPVANEIVTSIIRYNNFFILGGASGNLYKSNGSFTRIKPQKLSFSIPNKIKDFEISKEGELFIATDGSGIYVVNDKFELLNHFVENSDNPKSISSNGVYDIEFGREDILWVATYGGGVNFYDANRLPFRKIQHQINNPNSIAVNFTSAIAVDANQNIWFGTKKGVSIWNVKKNTWKHIASLENNGEADVVLALASDEDYMWVGTFNKGFYKVDVNTHKSTSYQQQKQVDLLQKVYAIYKDDRGNVWIGGIKKDVVVVRPNGKIDTYPITQIKTFTVIKNGNILACGRNGVYEINDKTKEFHLIEALKPNKTSLAFATINAVCSIKEDQIALATNGAGLVFYNLKSKQIKKITLKSGMPSDIVQGVLQAKNNDLWVSTTKGLAQIKIQDKDTLINVFNKKDGLTSTEFVTGSCAKLNDSLFAFGGVEGVNLFNPEKIKTKHYKPTIVFDTFKLFNKAVLPGNEILKKHINATDEITLKNNENSIEISFLGILHGASSETKYVWKLEGFDTQWSTPSETNFATYTNLNSGDYVFKVKALNKYNQYSDERQLKIHVKSSWWTTVPAYLLYALLVLGIIYLIVHVTSIVMKKRNADEQIDFFNNVTHEIKTPLAILISSLDSVTENTDSIVNGEAKKRIKTTVKRINSLFEQMLNFHKLTAQNHVSQEVSKIKLNAHLEKIIAEFYPLLKERELSVELINKWSDEFFYHDKSVFNKIVFNLLSNAIKYSSNKGKITLTTGTTMQGELKIEVIDEGIGIPKDQQKHILKRYYRARNVINSQRSGTGLGLVMVKKLLEKTGGSISFKSEENEGTVFTVLLKNQIKAYKKQEVDIETVNTDTEVEYDDLKLDEFSDNKILIVEDNEELREALAKKLATYFQVYEAKNGKEGLQMASQFFPDLILTDLIMPEMDGMQMARQLKDDINLNHIPVFMLTVLQNSTQKLESIEAGIVEYIEKPVNMKMLLAKITNILQWQKKLQKKYIHENDAEKATLFRNKNDQEFLQNLEDRIIENIVNNSFSVHDLSESFGMSRTSLYMKLKNLVDLSPQDFIIHTKLKHAKNLLIKGGMSIKEVAYNSGFSNPKYFSTSFKKFYGMTPTAFLDSLKEND